MTFSYNLLFATVAICAAFYCGVEYRDYQMKSQVCHAVADFGASLNQKLAPNNPCQPYV